MSIVRKTEREKNERAKRRERELERERARERARERESERESEQERDREEGGGISLYYPKHLQDFFEHRSALLPAGRCV